MSLWETVSFLLQNIGLCRNMALHSLHYKRGKRPRGLCGVSYVVSDLARFARGRIEDSSFNRFALNGIPEFPTTLFFGIIRKNKNRPLSNFFGGDFVLNIVDFLQNKNK